MSYIKYLTLIACVISISLSGYYFKNHQKTKAICAVIAAVIVLAITIALGVVEQQNLI